MTNQEKIDVMQGHEDGEAIQLRAKIDTIGMWGDCPDPLFNFAEFDYRIKPPEPEYVWHTAAGIYRRCEAMNTKDWDNQGRGKWVRKGAFDVLLNYVKRIQTESILTRDSSRIAIAEAITLTAKPEFDDL